MTDPVDTAAARALADAATGGPWFVYDRNVGFHIAVEPDDGHSRQELIPEGFKTDIGRREDAEFIAAARELVPAMADEIDRLVDESQRHRTAWHRSRDCALSALARAEASEKANLQLHVKVTELQAKLDRIREFAERLSGRHMIGATLRNILDDQEADGG